MGFARVVGSAYRTPFDGGRETGGWCVRRVRAGTSRCVHELVCVRVLVPACVPVRARAARVACGEGVRCGLREFTRCVRA